MFLEISQNSWENTCAESLFFIKLRFPVNFAKFLRTPFLTEHHWWLLLFIGSLHNETLSWNTHFMNSYENISRCILTLSVLFFQKRLFSFIIQNAYFRTTTLIQNWNFFNYTWSSLYVMVLFLCKRFYMNLSRTFYLPLSTYIAWSIYFKLVK